MFSNATAQTLRRGAVSTLERMAEEGSRSRAVQQLVGTAANLLFASYPERVQAAWRWLPTRYVRDRDGDNWQSAEETLRREQGDCEDWAVLLCAVLKALGQNAHIGVMPEHAAVFVPVEIVSLFDPRVQRSNFVPSTWRTALHQGRVWLPLEATTLPKHRGEPGWNDQLIRPWLNTGQLSIAQA